MKTLPKHITEDYRRGYMYALETIYDDLTELHQDDREFDRHLIDEIWSRVKRKEILARNEIIES